MVLVQCCVSSHAMVEDSSMRCLADDVGISWSWSSLQIGAEVRLRFSLYDVRSWWFWTERWKSWICLRANKISIEFRREISARSQPWTHNTTKHGFDASSPLRIQTRTTPVEWISPKTPKPANSEQNTTHFSTTQYYHYWRLLSSLTQSLLF